MDCVWLTQRQSAMADLCEHVIEYSGAIMGGELFNLLRNCHLLKTLHYVVPFFVRYLAFEVNETSIMF
jgi:hypothetical protein